MDLPQNVKTKKDSSAETVVVNDTLERNRINIPESDEPSMNKDLQNPSCWTCSKSTADKSQQTDNVEHESY